MSGFKTRLSVDCVRCGKPAYFNKAQFLNGYVADVVSGVRLQYALRVCDFDGDGEVVGDKYEGEDAGLAGSFPLCDDCADELEDWLFKGSVLKQFEEECE